MTMCVQMFLNSKHLTRKGCRLLWALKQNQKYVSNLIGDNSRLLSTTTSVAIDRRFTDKHEWISLDGKIGTIGITHYAQDSLGDVVYAQLPDVGTIVEQKDECGALESVKAASELYCPVSGKVVEKNSSVEETPGLINKSCYEKGWLFKVELTNPKQLEDLMTENEYEKFLKTDVH